MPFNHSIVPLENQSGLYRLLILAQFLHKSSQFRDARVESSLEPLIQFFPSAISEHLGTLLKQRIEAFQLGMDLANLPKRHAFFFDEVHARTKHQSHGAAWRQFDGCRCLAHLDPWLLHTAQSQKKSLNGHA
jgi:hypothetical protein